MANKEVVVFVESSFIDSLQAAYFNIVKTIEITQELSSRADAVVQLTLFDVIVSLHQARNRTEMLISALRKSENHKTAENPPERGDGA